jgi:hypothetical protein
MSLKDDVTVILLLGVSFMLGYFPHVHKHEYEYYKVQCGGLIPLYA